jgi:hypothetical protein
VFLSILLCAAERSYVLSGLLESGGGLLLLLLWLNAGPATGPVQLLGDVELGGGARRDLQHVAVAHRHLQTGEKEGVLRSGVYKEMSSIFAEQ